METNYGATGNRVSIEKFKEFVTDCQDVVEYLNEQI